MGEVQQGEPVGDVTVQQDHAPGRSGGRPGFVQEGAYRGVQGRGLVTDALSANVPVHVRCGRRPLCRRSVDGQQVGEAGEGGKVRGDVRSKAGQIGHGTGQVQYDPDGRVGIRVLREQVGLEHDEVGGTGVRKPGHIRHPRRSKRGALSAEGRQGADATCGAVEAAAL
ncbi:hypothetical protein [Kitasatospora kifunensis]|uniref:Uncharacterized protein n=1 Tax=Kitasatospora kifunensis TaxID=58351 RepID=A0A7W7RB92_KITKI|nr:hypothetical protein [Kitasatospora kifunensis]MBB4928807.1 hypothetical protein [Kitasatospora kifunensis]